MTEFTLPTLPPVPPPAPPAPPPSPPARYALVQHGVVTDVIESVGDPDGSALDWVICANAGPGWVTADGVMFTPPPPPPPDPRLWWVGVGPFKDRLGMDGMAMAASDDGVCRAVKEMLAGREYVNLKDPRTLGMLGLLQSNGQPLANVKFPGSGPMTAAKILAITNTPTVDAERYIKGL